MKKPEIIQKEQKRDMMWAEMRSKMSSLYKIVFTANINYSDFILLYSCLQLVLIDIELYEEYFMEYKNEEHKDIVKDFKRILENENDDLLEKELFYKSSNVFEFNNHKIPIEKRQAMLETFRVDVWKNMVLKKQEINEIFHLFPSLSSEQTNILYQCITVVFFELMSKSIEIDMIEGYWQ